MFEPVLDILKHWSIAGKALRPDILIAGSPERTEFRTIVESEAGEFFIVERIKPQVRKLKERIAMTLEFLKAQGIDEVYSYQRSQEGGFVVSAESGLWQVVPYVPGEGLIRPQYVFEEWRGERAADLLLRLHQATVVIPFFADDQVFSLPDYIEKLMLAIQTHRPDVLSRVQAMHSYVRKNLYPGYDTIPGSFCHGDYHPLNIIWNECGIAALIDWEFVGIKPELYDAANMIGCLGIEDPQCLWKGMAKDFISRLMVAGDFFPQSRTSLLDLVIGLRFAWLSEWLRKNDEEMVEMELDYFDVLVANKSDLFRAWRLPS